MAIPTTTLGSTGLEVSQLGLGGAPLGELFECLPETQAQGVMQSAYEQGVSFFDTAPWYGHGMSEHRMGHYLRQQSRDSFVLSTKVGRLYRAAKSPEHRTQPWVGGLPFELHFDYSYDGIMRSWQDSLMRLGLNRIDMLVIHDLDVDYHGQEGLSTHRKALESSGYKALEELKNGGQVRAIGAGVNHGSMMAYFIESFELDFLLVAMPYTLLDQTPLQGSFQSCEDKNVSVVIGSPYASGILATGPIEGARYNYAPASRAILDKVHRIEAVCVKHSTCLAAVALQFCLAHPIVAASIPGATHKKFVSANITNLFTKIPPALWDELKSLNLIAAASPIPQVLP
ncbi:MAG: aldo/keto reductase [Proteobacteria bacterium]|nr:aldo/keto reductase [Pseudomonadota bacterium]